MSDRIAITIDGEAQLQASLAEAAERLQDSTELMERIGALMKQNVELRFGTMTAPDGTAWAPLSPKTVEIYESEWFIARNPAFAGGIPGSLLERTRRMRNSLDYNHGDGFVEIGFSSATNTTRAGKVYDKAQLHEFGTKRMPARRLLTANPETGTLGDQDREDILAEISSYLSEML